MSTVNEFKIPTENIVRVESKIAKLNKRAIKNNLEPISYTLGTSYLVKTQEETSKKSAVYVEYTPLTVIGVTPVVEGWKIIGSVEHINGVSLISNAPGVEHVDNKYRERAAYCDHCNTKRVKKYSFIIENIETGETKQVGKSCLKDFLNAEIKYQLSYLEWFSSFIDELSDDESEYYSGTPEYASVQDILGWAAYAIRTSGYQKSDSEYPTKAYVSNLLWNPRARQNDNGPDAKVSEDDKATAHATIEWIESTEATNDYIITLKDLVKAQAVPYRFFGQVVSAIVVFLKVEAEVVVKKIEAERPFLDEYIGEVKVRQEFELEIQKILTFDSYYGSTYLHIFNDVGGRSLVWWGSKKLRDNQGDRLESGTKVRVKATVKEHKLYNEKKQTVITRVALQDILEDFS